MQREGVNAPLVHNGSGESSTLKRTGAIRVKYSFALHHRRTYRARLAGIENTSQDRGYTTNDPIPQGCFRWAERPTCEKLRGCHGTNSRSKRVARRVQLRKSGREKVDTKAGDRTV